MSRYIPAENEQVLKSYNLQVPITARYSVLHLKTRLPPIGSCNTVMHMYAGTTEQAIRQFYVPSPGSDSRTNVAALNFANAHGRGGSYLDPQHVMAQEEELMRCAPALYPSLYTVQYPFDSERELLYTQDVEFWRSGRQHQYALYSSAARSDIITAAAPDLRGSTNLEFDQVYFEPVLLQLLDAVMRAPLLLNANVDTLILGAFGCGVFANDPRRVSRVMHQLLTGKYANTYQRVVFAIPDAQSYNYRCFADVFGDASRS